MTEIQIFYDGPIVKLAEAKGLKLKRYFTGKPCKRGHVSERISSSRQCMQCYKTSEALARKSAYDTQRHRERSSEVSEYNKSYYMENAGRIRANTLKYKAENLEAVKERDRAYFRSERGLLRLRVGSSKRRALVNGADGEFTRDDILDAMDRQGKTCAAPWCDADLSIGYDVDHIIPLSRGGSNWPDNLQCLCPTCNRSKGAKTMDEWIEWRVVLGLSVDEV